MKKEEAQEYAKTMSYKKAVLNCIHAKGIAYRKASLIKLQELAEIADKLERNNGMTKEEAIQVLKDTYSHWLRLKEEHSLSCSECEDTMEAIDMAISALQEESRPIKVRDDGTLFVKVFDVSKVERIIISDDSTAIREDFPKPFSNNITELPNEVVEKNDEVIKSVRCKDCKWFNDCENFVTPPCRPKQTEPSDKGGDAKMSEEFKPSTTPMQQTPSKDGVDLISRAEALMELNGACSNWQDDATVAEIIQALPSVSAERVGEWEWRGFNIECSVCGNMPTFDSTESLPNYCPYCGARMENKK